MILEKNFVYGLRISLKTSSWQSSPHLRELCIESHSLMYATVDDYCRCFSMITCNTSLYYFPSKGTCPNDRIYKRNSLTCLALQNLHFMHISSFSYHSKQSVVRIKNIVKGLMKFTWTNRTLNKWIWMYRTTVNKHYLFLFISQLMRKLIGTVFRLPFFHRLLWLTDSFIPSSSRNSRFNIRGEYWILRFRSIWVLRQSHKKWF